MVTHQVSFDPSNMIEHIYDKPLLGMHTNFDFAYKEILKFSSRSVLIIN